MGKQAATAAGQQKQKRAEAEACAPAVPALSFAALKSQMQRRAAYYGDALPARDTSSLILGLHDLLIAPPTVRQIPLGERDGAFDPEHNVILINSDVSPRRQRFTLAHEIGHALLLDDDDLLSDLHDLLEGEQLEQGIETLCNVAAAEILMPRALVQDLLARFGPSGQTLAELSRRADVSAAAALYTLAEQTNTPTLYAVCSPAKGAKRGAAPLTVKASAAAHTRYTLRAGTPIPDTHPVAKAYAAGLPEAAESYVPFRSGRKMPAYVQAYPSGRQVLVSFGLPAPRGVRGGVQVNGVQG